jgi:SMC interacting uncharacterized protein involved in chromosome segregation
VQTTSFLQSETQIEGHEDQRHRINLERILKEIQEVRGEVREIQKSNEMILSQGQSVTRVEVHINSEEYEKFKRERESTELFKRFPKAGAIHRERVISETSRFAP